MKHLVLFATLFLVILSMCCKFMTKGEWSKHNPQKRLPNPKDNETKEKQDGDWSNIPTHISELILSRLSRADFYRFGEVCTSWRHAVTESILYRSSSPLPSIPLLLVYQLPILNDMKAGLFSLKEQKMYLPKRPLFRGTTHCLGSIKGWFIMVDTLLSDETISSSNSTNHLYPSFFFWNPISDARVMLPSKLDIPYPMKWYKLFGKVKASSGPGCPNCLVAGLFTARHHIAFCRPNDESWSIISVENTNMNIVFSDIELLHGKCYVLTETFGSGILTSILIYDLRDPSPLQAKTLISLRHQSNYSPRACSWRPKGFRNLCFQNHIFYYLASDPESADLYLIFMIADINIYHPPRGQSSVPKYISPPEEKEFVIYKVDMSNETQLVRVLTLNGGILFLSHKGSNIVSSSTLTGPKDLIIGNTIYFVHAYPYKENLSFVPQIVKFCVSNGRISHIPLPNFELDPEPTCLWFMPTLW